MRLEKGDIQRMAEDKNVERRQRFAARVRRLMLRLLVVWFVVSFGFGILMVEPLNEIRLGGYKLGVLVCTAGIYLHFYRADLRVFLCYDASGTRLCRR